MKKKCAYCEGPEVIHTNSHYWDKDPISDMGCYKNFDGIRLHGFAKWKYCPICGRNLGGR